ncbi:MAG: hypothetical protein HC895_25250 [Leptolyngbyaceae cyanobacterium SM1_3_5]|nr:hypothetical protein [Leptolyngbyaceae cyanobacterium SM1_3_5]
MNYQEQLNPWVIHQMLPDLKRSLVMRFRRRVDAESYLKVIQQMRPKAQFAIAFETSSMLKGEGAQVGASVPS